MGKQESLRIYWGIKPRNSWRGRGRGGGRDGRKRVWTCGRCGAIGNQRQSWSGGTRSCSVAGREVAMESGRWWMILGIRDRRIRKGGLYYIGTRLSLLIRNEVVLGEEGLYCMFTRKIKSYYIFYKLKKNPRVIPLKDDMWYHRWHICVIGYQLGKQITILK